MSALLQNLGGKKLLDNLEIDVITAELPEDQAINWLPNFTSVI